ncbi:MAG: hypothetical protein AAF432_11915 [Planctomycetota bacterium]
MSHPHASSPTESATAPCFRVVLHRGTDRWGFSWNPGDERALVRELARLAKNPDVPLDHEDVLVVLRQVAQEIDPEDLATMTRPDGPLM